jgi:hypothetical protein
MTLRKLLTGALALSATAAVLAPTLASAQGYGDDAPPPPAYDRDSGYSYDACHRDTVNRSVAGTLIGAALGAAVGSNIAASGHRTDGSILGGVVGGLAGHHVGRESAACNDDRYGYGGGGYDRGSYDRGGYGGGYADGYDRHAYYRPAYTDGADYAPPPPPPEAYAPDYDRGDSDCRMAESPIYMPDGHVEHRMVQVCRDSRGQYQVVN